MPILPGIEVELVPYCHTGCLKKTVPRLSSCCGGAVNSIISGFKQLHRSDFKLELLEIDGNALFEVTIYFAFSLS